LSKSKLITAKLLIIALSNSEPPNL